MINDTEFKTYENTERAIVKRLIEDTMKYGRKNHERKQQNADEVLKLSNYIVNKLSVEYLNFLIRFYKKKTQKQAEQYIHRFLNAINRDYNSLNVSAVYRQYNKVIHTRLMDYTDEQTEHDDAEQFYENSFKCAYLLYTGQNLFHFI